MGKSVLFLKDYFITFILDSCFQKYKLALKSTNFWIMKIIQSDYDISKWTYENTKHIGSENKKYLNTKSTWSLHFYFVGMAQLHNPLN